MSLTIIDPERGSIKALGTTRDANGGSLSKVQDRVLRADLIRVRKDGARSHKRFIYDQLGLALGIVTFEPCNFDTKTGRKKGR